MHRLAAIAMLGCLLLSPQAVAWRATVARPSLLLADVELVELAPPDQRYDQAEDAARASMLSKRIRAAVVASGHYRLLSGEGERKPPHRYIDCKACIVDWAHRHDADYVLVVWVQKESRLILMINMALIDVAHPDRRAAGGSVDLRGDTDDTWLAGARQMLDRTLAVAMPP
jgi:hypothetical protein